MKPRWVRSTPAAVTDRIGAVPSPSTPATVSVPRPRTLRLRPVAARRAPRDLRVVEAGAALQQGLDGAGIAAVVGRVRSAFDQRTWPPGATKVLVYAADAALTTLAEPHRRYELHRHADCARCTPVELCPWHYARLRSWWDARDRAAALLISRVDDALAGREVQ